MSRDTIASLIFEAIYKDKSDEELEVITETISKEMVSFYGHRHFAFVKDEAGDDDDDIVLNMMYPSGNDLDEEDAMSVSSNMLLPNHGENIDMCQETLHFADTQNRNKKELKEHFHKLMNLFILRIRSYDAMAEICRVCFEYNLMDPDIINDEMDGLQKHMEDLDEFKMFKQQREFSNKTCMLSSSMFVYALDALMLATDLEGKVIFNKQRHWIAVFRVAADFHLIGDNDYEGFIKWIQSIHPAPFRMKLSKSDLKQISNSDCYYKSFDKWRFYPQGNIKRAPYEGMVSVVKTFKNLLQKEIDKAKK